MISKLKGIPRTEEVKKKISEKLKGRKIPLEQVERMKNTLMIKHPTRGKKLGPLSLERRNNMSLSKMGHYVSEETKRKISESQKGRKQPPQVLAAVIKANTGRIGRIPTEEEKLKASIRMKQNNPMNNPEIVKKIHETKKKNNNLSKGQLKLYEILNTLNLIFVEEKCFKVNNNKLYFSDAYLPNHNISIEYDGHQIHEKKPELDIKKDKDLFSCFGIYTIRIKRLQIFNEEFSKNLILTYLKFYKYIKIRNKFKRSNQCLKNKISMMFI
jgi:very-short-patch-repair endonuclease